MTIASGIPVKSGYYLDAKGLKFTRIERDGDALPGGPGARWTRVPVAVVLAAAPVLGGLFVVAFPIIGVAALGLGIARKLSGGVKDRASELAATLAPGPLAGEAHLTGKPGEEKKDAEKAATPELDALASKIEEKRKGK